MPAACSRSRTARSTRIAKLIPEGPKVYLDDCLKPGAELKQAYDSDPLVKRDRRPREAARGARPPGLDPRRRRRDRRPAADRRRPAAAEGRRPGGRDAVRDGRRRGARPAEDGLPRPAQPGRDRQGGRARRRPRHRRRSRSTTARTYEMLARGDVDRRLPVRVVGHARGAAAGEADRVRGPDRARRALPARADGATSRSTRAARTARSR